MTIKIKREREIYWLQVPFLENFFNRVLIHARKNFFKIFKSAVNYNANKSLIDIGTTANLKKEQNLILQKTKNNKNIYILSNQNCNILKEKFPNIKKIYKVDGRKNSLRSNYFDIVHSNATIEHVGSFKNQIAFVKECLRLSKKFVFIQTPNRFFPIDFHTKLPLIHWLPKKIHRILLKFLRLHFYSLEKNLNLLCKSDLINICNQLNIRNFKIIDFKLLFVTSNLILIIKK
jgi:hypothetical protein